MAKYVEEHLLTDEESIMRLAQQNRTIVQRIKHWIDTALAALGNADAKERAFLYRAQTLYAKALKQTKMQAQGITAKERLGYLRADFNAGLLTQEEFDNELEEIMAEDDWETVNEEGEENDDVKNDFSIDIYKNKDLSKNGEIYKYDFLTSLPNVQITKLPEVAEVRSQEKEVDNKKVVLEGMKNARSVGTERAGKVFIKNSYTGRELAVGTGTIRHGLNGSINRLLTNARFGAVIGDVVKNAVPINAMKNKSKDATGTYAMAAYATDSQGREFVAIITVEQRSGDVFGIEAYDVVHAVSARQKRGQASDLHTRSRGLTLSNLSEISIHGFIEIVNTTHQSILSNDVLERLGEKKKENGEYTEKVIYSITQYTPR